MAETTVITVLSVPDCPTLPLLEDHLAAALGDRRDVTVQRRPVTTPEEAEQWGMRGSPTLLVDGVDPFAAPGTATSLSCRICPGPDDDTSSVPSVARLRAALGSGAR